MKENTPEVPLNAIVDTTIALRGVKGDFMKGPYGPVSAMATFYAKNGDLLLPPGNMMNAGGPQLYLHLPKEKKPVNFSGPVPLQSTHGYQSYPVPGEPNLSWYQYELVHCKKYNHLFGVHSCNQSKPVICC